MHVTLASRLFHFGFQKKQFEPMFTGLREHGLIIFSTYIIKMDEASFYGDAGLGLAMTKGRDEAIAAGQGTNKVKVKLPGGGKYRLYVYCFDGRGNAAYANWPLICKGKDKSARHNIGGDKVPDTLFFK